MRSLKIRRRKRSTQRSRFRRLLLSKKLARASLPIFLLLLNFKLQFLPRELMERSSRRIKIWQMMLLKFKLLLRTPVHLLMNIKQLRTKNNRRLLPNKKPETMIHFTPRRDLKPKRTRWLHFCLEIELIKAYLRKLFKPLPKPFD